MGTSVDGGLPAIFTLPDELLVLIIGYVHGHRPFPKEADDDAYRFCALYFPRLSTDLQRARLVCRRFRNVSSDFFNPLFRFIEVTPTASSLARFDGIARHSALSKHIVCVRIVLEHYNTPVDRFSTAIAESFEDAILDEGDTDPQFEHIYQQRRPQLDEAIEKADRMLDSWDGDGDPTNELVASDVALVQELSGEYASLFMTLQACLEETFVPAIVKSLAMLSSTPRIVITDESRRAFRAACAPRPGIEAMVNDPASFIRRTLFTPLAWSTPFALFQLNHMSPPTHLLVDLPLAIREAGIPLRQLHFNLYDSWCWQDDMKPELSAEKQTALENLANGLDVFEYSGRCPPDLSKIPEFAKFLEILAAGNQLTKLKLDLERPVRMTDNDAAEHLNFVPADLSPVLHSALSPKLQSLTLEHCSVSEASIETIFAQYAAKSVEASLNGLNLVSGRWARVLDIVREKATGSGYTALQDAKGQECESMEEAQYDAVFPEQWDPKGVSGGAGSATAYIQGHRGDGQPNPFLV